jgi:hypothetical protein
MVTADMPARAARAREALMARHAELREVLDHWAGALAATADTGGPVRPVRSLLRAFVADEVLQIRAEERTLYPAARRDPGVSLLVQALTGEHRDLASMAGKLGSRSGLPPRRHRLLRSAPCSPATWPRRAHCCCPPWNAPEQT